MSHTGYYVWTIASFGDKETQALYDRAMAKRIEAAVQPAAFRKLRYLDHAACLDDLRAMPGNRLETLSGRMAGLLSFRINRRWRIVFRWEAGRAHEVRVIDYH